MSTRRIYGGTLVVAALIALCGALLLCRGVTNLGAGLIGAGISFAGLPLIWAMEERSGPMSRGLNRVTLIGNLGNDPTLQYTDDGVPLSTASLAVGGTRKQPDGTIEESVEWFRLVFFDRQAETINTYGAKGKAIFVEGRLQTRPYTDRNGVIRTAIEVVVSQFLLLGEQAKETP